jgi:CRP-like cAMP-binding protein
VLDSLALTVVKRFTAAAGRRYAACPTVAVKTMHRNPLFQLPDHPLLSALSAAELERVQQASEHVALLAGETLFNAGDEARRFFMVLEGHLKLYQLSPNGQEKVIELLTPGKTFAEAVMFMPKRRYPLFCEALSDSTVCALNADVFLDICDSSPGTTMRLLGALSIKLRTRLADIEALAFQNATLRVVGYLLDLVPPDAERSTQLELPAQKKDVAARLSLQPETFSRVLARLRAGGLVMESNGQLTLPDLPALRKLAWKP